ncbi:MAG: hypothetical protein IJ593_05270 [Lachnospiraceae bacterium]|nr:hypothetical protein [Lachnospiraceae bacterium]
MKCNFRLETDFSDYYDAETNNEGALIYRRMDSERLQRGQELKLLSSKIKNTIPFGKVSDICKLSDRVVVYTNVNKHNGEGKIICNSRMALDNFKNYLASPFIENTKGKSVKFLVIGDFIYKIYMHNDEFDNTLKAGVVDSIKESNKKEFSVKLDYPIYSVDFIVKPDGSLVACDFNSVENLSKLGFNKILSIDDILIQINKSLVS